MDYNTLFTPSNTFANTTFDIMKMDAIEDPLINVNKLATMDLEESYFALTVNFINECNNELTNHKVTLYRALSEAHTTEVVLESFSDFFSSVKDIIEKFLKFIKSIFDRFINAIAGMVGSDNYLNKHKKDLDGFKSTDNFDITGYEYTFSSLVPSSNAVLEWNTDLFSDLIGDANNNLTVDGVKATVNVMQDAGSEYYDKFRAKILNKPGQSITLSDYSEELFRVYRNDELDADTIEIDSSQVRKAKERYFNYKKTKSDVERQKKDIDNAYHKIEERVKDITKRNSDLSVSALIKKFPDANGITTIDGKTGNAGVPMASEIMAQLDAYVKIKVDQIQEISNIHALAFSAKLDALKECYKQDRSTLYTALSRIMRTDAARAD